MTLILSILGLVPGLLTFVQGWQQRYYDTKVRLTMARLNVDRDVATKLIDAQSQADHENTAKLSIFAGNKILTFMLVGFATPLIAFIWKVVVVDIVIGPGCIFGFCWVGSTDPIKGQVAEWATTIIGFLFGTSGAVTIGKM